MEVATSDMLGAGTDAQVSIRMWGTNGHTRVLPLANGALSPGQICVFTVTAAPLGKLVKAEVSSNAQVCSPWTSC